MDVSDVAATGEFDPEALAKATLFETDRLFADVYGLEPGQAQDVHAHDDADKIYYVLDGTATVTVGDETRTLGAGEAVLAPAGTRHGLRNDGEERVRALVMVAWGEGTDDDGHAHEHGHARDVTASFAVLTVTSSRDADSDESGAVARAAIEDAGHEVVGYDTVPDDARAIRAAVREQLHGGADAVVTSGGTGLTPDDETVGAVRALFDVEIPGFGEYFRRLSHEQVGTAAMLSRATAGVVGDGAVFALPGSPDAVELGVSEAVLPEIGHLLGLARRD